MESNNIYNICQLDVKQERTHQSIIIYILNEKGYVVVRRADKLSLYEIVTGQCTFSRPFHINRTRWVVMSEDLIADNLADKAVWYNKNNKKWEFKVYTKSIAVEILKFISLPLSNVYPHYARLGGKYDILLYVDFNKTNPTFIEFDAKYPYDTMKQHPLSQIRKLKISGLGKEQQLKHIYRRFNRILTIAPKWKNIN
ncbi:unnamed protein product [Bursaphelenchus okinawaensis]|uniref:Uncharacterized protein n=1 Tax=Bursaphelenchus okinawaensis TaxID=465554 RepID=A0A811KJN0_9BILA|nr:unnamed protein product [Bursaphelenchus okinawaensis]CAG9105088.1 unnamed protein product [Bursaphelenchus okinawaensis]